MTDAELKEFKKLVAITQAAVTLVCSPAWGFHELTPAEAALEKVLRDAGWIESEGGGNG